MAEWGSESGHWYQRDGAPCYEIMGANGKMRPTTLRDARKLNLVPSTTGVINQIAKPGLEAWKSTQLLLAGLTLPRLKEEVEVAWLDRVRRDAKAQAAMAADRGTAIHGAIEAHFRGEDLTEEQMAYHNQVRGVKQALNAFCGPQEWSSEKSFATDGYGGKVDLHSDQWVLDYKTKEFGPGDAPELYDEHPMQLAAYTLGLGYNVEQMHTGIVWVSVSVPGLVVITRIGDNELMRGYAMFKALLNYWWAKNGSVEYQRCPS